MENFRELEKELKRKQFSRKGLQHSNRHGKGGAGANYSDSSDENQSSSSNRSSDAGDGDDENQDYYYGEDGDEVEGSEFVDGEEQKT